MSTPFNFKGTNRTFRGANYHWKRGRGWDSDQTWRGSWNALTGLITTFQAQGNVDEIFFGPTGDGAYELSVNYSTEGSSPITGTIEPPINSWELIGQDQLQDIKLHPNNLALGIGMVDGIATMVSELQKETDLTTKLTTYTTFRNTISAVCAVQNISAANALALFEDLITGHTHFHTPTFVLRHTKTVTKRYQSKVSFTNIGLKQYACTAGQGGQSGTLTAELASAGTPITPEVFLDLKAIPVPATRTGYTFGWIKKSPQSRPAPFGKYEIVQEYWLDQWRSTTYTPV